MISTGTARALRAAGLTWHPQRGDRFVIDLADSSELDDEVFVLSDMTVDVHDFPGGQVLGFNGTVEWALDSVRADQALWLPHEHQLRELLGTALRRLEHLQDWWRVIVELDGREASYSDPVAEEAYGQAVLAVLAVLAGLPVLPGRAPLGQDSAGR